ncbi:MAG TPA: LptF/LptG family permease [Thermoanaerobaculia bacterium]|jgi:LPS export ABC transporter permease LptG/LPS export ABC transporter permease LptF
MLRRLDRYLLAEILGPLALGLLIYTFVLLLRVLFRSAELIIGSDVAVSTVGKLLLLSLPNIVVLTIPMSFLFAILIAVGRLSSDSELVAIRASGVSLFSLYRPILLLSAVLTGLNVYLMLELLPEGNHALQQLRMEIVTQGLSEEIVPRVPHTGWQGKMLYVFEAPPGERRWKGTLLSEAIPAGQTQVEVAEWGEARAVADGSQIVLSLTNAFTHRVDLNHPETYEIFAHQTIDMTLTAERPRAVGGSVQRGLRELPLSELRTTARDPETPPMVRKTALVEIHKKFSIPAACVVFGLLGLPLGFSNARGGRSSGFAISIGVLLVYYILLNWGEDFAKKGATPAGLAVWAPNLTFLLVGMLLLVRRNRDKSLVLSRLDKWVREDLWRRLLHVQERRRHRRRDRRSRGRAYRPPDRVVLRFPEIWLPFPTAIDRYVLRTFLRVLLLATMSGLVVYIAADLTENAEDILKNDVPRQVVADYYKLRSFDIIYEISPVIVLITTLLSFGLLSRTNEITAFKALGMSLYRLALPVLLAAAVISALCALLQMEVLAASNERVAELRARIRGRETPTRLQRADQRWLYGKQGGFLYNYALYDGASQELYRLQVFRFDSDYRLVQRLVVDKATYLGDGWWTFSSGWARQFAGTQVTDFRMLDEPVKERLPEPPEFFAGVPRLPEEMTFAELREHIQDLRAFGGKDTAPLEVELHNKVAYPVLAFVMALVALPFAFRLGRQGALYGIGLSLLLGFALLIFLGFFRTMGHEAILPPMVAVWSPGAIFSIFALYLFLGVKT